MPAGVEDAGAEAVEVGVVVVVRLEEEAAGAERHVVVDEGLGGDLQ